MNTHVTHDAPPGQPMATINWRIVVRFVLVAMLVPLILFVAAGHVNWWQGWVYVTLTIGVSFVSRFIMLVKNPSLFAERARFTESEGVKDWDKRIVVWIATIGPVAFMITAGLDKRLGWSPELPVALELGALLVFLLGFALATWALAANAFFSSVVRIQTERGHGVVTSGPYRFVRHPGYSGAIVSWLTSPLMLGSLWSFVPAGIVVLLYIVRTALEDRTLHAELPGYTAYAQHTRYRILPGLW